MLRADRPPLDAPERRRLTTSSGLAGLSLDAMASVAYGPEAIALVLATAGTVGLGFTLPVSAAIVVLLVVLVLSYRQVIRAYPEGGGSYGVARARLGRPAALLAAASLVVDYVLNVAVSVAAGVAALASAVPQTRPYLVEIGLLVLVVITALNLRGLTASAYALAVPTVLFVGSVLTVIVVGLVTGGQSMAPAVSPEATQTVGVLLLLKAFASGCSALTGVEAIANAVPEFREPRVRRAQRTEVILGVLLGTMMLGIAALIERYGVVPQDGVTVLAQVTEGSLGHGVGYFLVQGATVLLLALAANTSFGGLPTLLCVVARDGYLPEILTRRNERGVYTVSVLALAATAAVLLVLSGADMNALVPLFAIGVFVGFTLAQAGMVRHWSAVRGPDWRVRAALNGFGALLTGVAAVVVLAMKFTAGAWAIALVLAVLVGVMARYRARGNRLVDHRR